MVPFFVLTVILGLYYTTVVTPSLDRIIRLLVICSQTTKPLKRKVICPLPKWMIQSIAVTSEFRLQNSEALQIRLDDSILD